MPDSTPIGQGPSTHSGRRAAGELRCSGVFISSQGSTQPQSDRHCQSILLNSDEDASRQSRAIAAPIDAAMMRPARTASVRDRAEPAEALSLLERPYPAGGVRGPEADQTSFGTDCSLRWGTAPSAIWSSGLSGLSVGLLVSLHHSSTTQGRNPEIRSPASSALSKCPQTGICDKKKAPEHTQSGPPHQKPIADEPLSTPCFPRRSLSRGLLSCAL